MAVASANTSRKVNASCCPLQPHTTPFPEDTSILGVIYGVVLLADMNAATPLGASANTLRKAAELELQRCISQMQASGPHFALSCPPYLLYGVKYIDPVSLAVHITNAGQWPTLCLELCALCFVWRSVLPLF